MKQPLISIIGLLILAGCSTSPAANYVNPVVETLNVNQIRYCSGYGCHTMHSIGLSPEEWGVITALFDGEVTSHADERKRVSLAVGVYETFATVKTGTEGDRPESPIMFNPRGQLDCIDEATNTSIFLHLLKKEGLIKKHTVSTPAQRGFIIGRWFHSTAVLVEDTSGDRYAIDSWFFKPGTPAAIVPLDEWLDFWEPEKTEIGD